MVWFWFLGLVLLQSASMFVLMPAPVGFSGTFSAVFSSTILIIFFSFSGKDFLLSCNYEHPLVLDRDGGEALGLLGGGGVLVNDGRLLTPFVSDSDDLLVEGWGLLIRFLQFLCCILGLSGWVGAHVLLLLVPGDETVDGGDDGGGVSSGFFNLWANFSLFSGFSGRLDPRLWSGCPCQAPCPGRALLWSRSSYSYFRVLCWGRRNCLWWTGWREVMTS